MVFTRAPSCRAVRCDGFASKRSRPQKQRVSNADGVSDAGGMGKARRDLTLTADQGCVDHRQLPGPLLFSDLHRRDP